ARFLSPFYAYGHGWGGAFTGIAIVGAAFYNPPAPVFPAHYVGLYFFADYGSGWINAVDPASGAVEAFLSGVSPVIPEPVGVQLGPDGALNSLQRGPEPGVHRITYSGTGAPVIGEQPRDLPVSVGEDARFTVSASGAPPLSFEWTRNGTPIPGAGAASYVLTGSA